MQRSGGAELLHDRMLISLSRTEQLMMPRLRYKVVENGQVENEESYDMTIRRYFKHEMELMLRIAEFSDVQWIGYVCTARK